MGNDNKHIDIISLMARYFAGEATVEEQIILDKWKTANAENQKELDSFEKLWNLTGNISEKEPIDIDSEWYKLDSKIIATHTKVLTLKRVIQLAAMLIVISGLALVGYYKLNYVNIRNQYAKIQEVELPDGSHVELNAHTQIRYGKRFGNTNRSLYLTGEAFFNVKRDTNLPFVITANGAQIEVLGTSFNVKAPKNKTEVKVYVVEGTVSLYDKKQKKVKTLLTAGESGNYNSEHGTVKKVEAVSMNDIAWKTFVIELEDTPMHVVKEILESTYHKEIIVDEAISNCPVTATFKNDSLQSVLNVLKAVLDIEISKEGNKIILKGTGC